MVDACVVVMRASSSTVVTGEGSDRTDKLSLRPGQMSWDWLFKQSVWGKLAKGFFILQESVKKVGSWTAWVKLVVMVLTNDELF